MSRRWLVVIIAGVALVLAVVGGTALYVKINNDRAPEELALSTPEPTAEPDTAAPPVSADDLAGAWTVAAGSQAGYRVDEVLNGQDVTVVGRTPDVSGSITVEGSAVTAAQVDVEMSSITTDSANRDDQFRSILSTDEFPTATFTLTAPMDVAGVVDGVVTVDGTGELTIAGTTQPVTVSFQAQTTADGVEVTGSVPVVFSDYGVDAPNLGFVKVEDRGTVEMLLVLER
jgi:polyisoprenoid-binding protein YceI